MAESVAERPDEADAHRGLATLAAAGVSGR
jgi:hypothetical protein